MHDTFDTPVWSRCSVSGCDRLMTQTVYPYCPDHLPWAGFVTNEQVAYAWVLLKRGATLYQAAVRAKCDPRDLDKALWDRLGTPKRPAASF